MSDTAGTARTRLRRIAERGSNDLEVIHRIIDAAWHCHVAFADEQGVHCIPMACWREADGLYIHGSNGSRLLKCLAAGAEACVTITHLDGLVLARSAFHHSMNYRSVIIYGRFEAVDARHKAQALEQFMRRIAPARLDEARGADRNELNATQLLRLPIVEAVAKIRTGGPKDDPTDMGLPVWAGVLPLGEFRGAPQRDPACTLDAPPYVAAWPSGG
jgi:nitroimidazol reductase NimA-like FMN-containing flavoprotein (pyridoxamine 5'-phosphate oxidase superfamily)